MHDVPDETGAEGEGITSVIRHTVKPGAEAEYEAWLRNLASHGRTFPGHRGASIIRPTKGSHTYTIIVRFDTIEHMQGWINSEIRQRLNKEVRPLLAQRVEVDIRTGLDFWFTPPTDDVSAISPPPQVKPYKQFLVILSAIFPLEILVHFLFDPLAEWLPVMRLTYIRDLFDAIVIVTALTFIIMPYYTRLIARWLYE